MITFEMLDAFLVCSAIVIAVALLTVAAAFLAACIGAGIEEEAGV